MFRDPRSLVVAVVFGALLGMGLGRFHPDRRPVLSACAIAWLTGSAILVWGSAPGDDMAAWSLLAGGPAAAFGLILPWSRKKDPESR